MVKTDPLGREIVVIATNNDGTVRRSETTFDIQSNVIEVKDSRDLKAFEYTYDMAGRVLYTKSMDAGEKWGFQDSRNKLIHTWDARNIHTRFYYDELDRSSSIKIDGALDLNQVTERFIYGDDPSIAQSRERNLRGQLVKSYDQAGTQENKLFNPEGTSLLSERKLLRQFTSEATWDDPSQVTLDSESYISKSKYDNIGRPLQQELPDGTTRSYVYNEGGNLEKLLISTSDGKLIKQEFVKKTSRDAKGFRQSIIIGNDVQIDYKYDPETFRLKRLRSKLSKGSGRIYQDIHYTYDAVGNLIHHNDLAQQPDAVSPNVIQGLNVSSHHEFEYDALYQLIAAKGRVHQALLQNDHVDHSRDSNSPSNWAKGTRHITLNNGASIERYTRKYDYDLNGNIKSIKHFGTSQNWTRDIWTSLQSNRSLQKHDLNDLEIQNPESRFDENGNCLYMPHLRNVAWNYRNNISKAVAIDRSDQGKSNDEEYYIYGGDGMRVRKITQRVIDVATNKIELTEKIYLNGCEIKRIFINNSEILKRITSHISDGTNHIAKIHAWEKDTLARETHDIAQKRIHYLLANHLGSASLELDEQGDIITYEEYFPFGGTSFQAGRNKRDIHLKDYRYSGKEQDDFTGLYYFGYRYYAHWNGGWMSPDPIGPKDGLNLYLYVHNNPVNLIDPNGLQSKKNFKSYEQKDTDEDYKKFYLGKVIQTVDGKKEYVTFVETKLEIQNGKEMLQPYVKTTPFTSDTVVDKKSGKVILNQPEEPFQTKNDEEKPDDTSIKTDGKGKSDSSDPESTVVSKNKNSDANLSPNNGDVPTSEEGTNDSNKNSPPQINIPNEFIGEEGINGSFEGTETGEGNTKKGDKNRNGSGTNPNDSLGVAQDGRNCKTPWWVQLLSIPVGFAYNFVDGAIIEPIKIAHDLISGTLWYTGVTSSHNNWSGIGKAADQGVSRVDMIIGIPLSVPNSFINAYNAAMNGDGFQFGYEAGNIYGFYKMGKSLAQKKYNNYVKGMYDKGMKLQTDGTLKADSKMVNKGKKLVDSYLDIRKKQVAKLEKFAKKHYKGKIDDTKWEFDNTSTGILGLYSATDKLVTIYEGAFTGYIKEFLPNVKRGDVLSFWDYDFLKSTHETFGMHPEHVAIHEGYHVYQNKMEPAFYNSNVGGPPWRYQYNPLEYTPIKTSQAPTFGFTLSTTGLEGAFNYAYKFTAEFKAGQALFNLGLLTSSMFHKPNQENSK